MRRLLHGLIGLSLLLGACSDDDAGDDLAAVTSVPDETTTSTTTTTEARTVAPDVIPQDESQITEEYVEAVLDSLYEVMLEATVLTRDAGLVQEPAIRIAEATNTPDASRALLNGLAERAAEGFVGYREQLEPVDVGVIKLHEVSVACIFAEVTFDASGITTDPGNAEAFRLFAQLIAATDEQRSSGINPTAWVLGELPATDDGSVPQGRCEA